MKPEIKEVFIGDKMLQKQDICVTVAQLRSPFYNELKVIRSHVYPILGWDEKAYEKRYERIKRILLNISNSRRAIDFLIFPEYAIHEDMLNTFVDFSDNNECICMVNYYDIDRRANITKIIFPNKNIDGNNIFDQYKLTPSDGDIDFLGKKDEVFDRNSVKNYFFRFIWDKKVEGKIIKHYFQVFNCIDYLNSAYDSIDYDKPGMIFIPACSNSVNEFYSIGDMLLRKSLGGENK
jgi:hypothetical protein